MNAGPCNLDCCKQRTPRLKLNLRYDQTYNNNYKKKSIIIELFNNYAVERYLYQTNLLQDELIYVKQSLITCAYVLLFLYLYIYTLTSNFQINYIFFIFSY